MIGFKKNLVFLVTRLARVSFLFVLLTAAFYLRTEDYKSTDLKVYPYEESKYFALGYKDTVADVIWLKVLQNIDYCEGDRAISVNQNSQVSKILDEKQKPSRCDQGWVYQWINFASDLAPRFQTLYPTGGTALSVLVDDREGAKKIFDKGLSFYPDDWVLNYRAGYHYLYEMQDPKQAANLLMMSYKNGGPAFLPALAAQLYTRIGQAAFSKMVLEQVIDEHPDSEASDRIRLRLKEANEALKSPQKR